MLAEVIVGTSYFLYLSHPGKVRPNSRFSPRINLNQPPDLIVLVIFMNPEVLQ